jgi:hypothetical protein
MIPRLSWWLASLVVTTPVIGPSLIVSGALPAASGTSAWGRLAFLLESPDNLRSRIHEIYTKVMRKI